MSSPEHDMYTTMSVATLGSSTIEEGPKKQYVHSPSKVFNEEKRPKSYFNKPDFFSTADISGAQPKRTHQRKELSDPLRVSDIDGASGQIKDRFLHTKRRVDPLQPTYQLPSCKVVPPEDPKFLRDNLNVDDIPGTRSTTKIVYQPRDNLKLDDIEGSSAGWKPRHRKIETRDIMYTQYAKKIKFQDRTTRVSNSLKPRYELYGIEVKDDPASEPRKLKPFIVDNHQLKTSDIEGAQAGYISQHQLAIPLDQRREFRNTNYIGDIKGANADSVKYSIATKREVHPLQPVYKSLDGDPLPGPIEPLIPKECLKFDASSFKTSGIIREVGVDGLLLHPSKQSIRDETQLDIITHRSISTHLKPDHNSSKALGSSRSREMSARSSQDKLADTGESFSGLGTGNTTSMHFYDTSDFGESKSYAEKFADSDCLVPKLETTESKGFGESESKKSTGRSGNITPMSHASSRKNSRTSVASRRAQQELEAELDAIRNL